MPKPSRWTAEKRYEIIQEVLRHKEPIAQIARRHGVSDTLIHRWRERFHEGGKAALSFEGSGASRGEREALEVQIEDLKKVIGEQAVRDSFFKKGIAGLRPGWEAVEEARVSEGMTVKRAMGILGLSRTSYYRHLRGMVNYERHPRGSVSEQHGETLRRVALKRPEAGHRKVRAYALAWEELLAQAPGASRMSCYRQLKTLGLIQPGRPGRHLREVRDRRRQMLEVPTELNAVLQGDFTDYETEDGKRYPIGCFTEYLSRFNLVSRVLDTETAVDLMEITEAALQEIVFQGLKLPPRVIVVTDNGPAMKSKAYRNFVKKTRLLVHVRGQKYHPQTIGREERYHGSLKLEHLYRVLPRNRQELVQEVEEYRSFHNHERLHMSLGYRTPAAVYLQNVKPYSSYYPAG